MRKPTRTTRGYPCIFRQPSISDVENFEESVYDVWRSVVGGKMPIGDLRNMWRRHHCATLNPYGSEHCPYPIADCVRAYERVTRATILVKPVSPVGYFIRVAKTDAAKRADEKPLTRAPASDSLTRTDGSDEPTRSGNPGPTNEGPDAGQGVRRPQSGPQSIGDLLRALDLRPRSGLPDDGEEGTE